MTAINACPLWWFQGSPNAVTFSCPFDQIYPNSFFSGACFHTPLTAAAGGDQQTLDFNDDDLDLAALVARNLMAAYLKSAPLDEILKERKYLELEMKNRKGSATSRNVGDPQRGRGHGERHVWLTNG